MRGSRSTILVVLLLALGVAGCSADSGAARQVVERIKAPAADWSPGGPRIEAYGDGIEEHDGIWVADDPDGDGKTDDDPTYLVSWQVVVKPGTEQQRCGEAAAWLGKAGERLPGQKVDAAATTPNPDALSAACLAVLKPMAEGSTSDSGYGTWPPTEKNGYRFSAGLAARISGSQLSLSVSVEAGPSSRYGS
jgi:hypothetical protein